MKVSLVVDSVSRRAGGVFFSVNSLALSLPPSGIITSVHGLRDADSDKDQESWGDLELSIHQTVGPRGIGYSPELTRSLLAGDQDLVHSHGVWQAQSHSIHTWHRRRQRPYLISPHGMLDPWALAQSRWKKRLAALFFENAHLRDSSCLHALCQSELESIRAHGLKNPVCLIPNGVVLPDYSERLAGGGGQQRENPILDFQSNAPRILLFLGRLHPKKGLMNAVRAWKEVTGHGSPAMGQDEWQFVIAGWNQGGHGDELKTLCQELGLSYSDTPASEFLESSSTALSPPPTALCQPPTVIFTGPVFGETKDALLRRADAFILPSFSEGLPMAVLEAWAHGLPVLMTDHCNLPEGFREGAALHIGTGVPSIAEGIRVLFQGSCQDLESMGAKGRTLVEKRFTWPKVAAQMKEVYEWMVGGGNKPGSVV